MVKTILAFVASYLLLVGYASCNKPAKVAIDGNIGKLAGNFRRAVAISSSDSSLSRYYDSLEINGKKFPSFHLYFNFDSSCNCIHEVRTWDGCNREGTDCKFLHDTIIIDFANLSGTKKLCEAEVRFKGRDDFLDTCIYRFRNDTLLLISTTKDTVFFVNNEQKSSE